jgi:hypothetical protein
MITAGRMCGSKNSDMRRVQKSLDLLFCVCFASVWKGVGLQSVDRIRCINTAVMYVVNGLCACESVFVIVCFVFYDWPLFAACVACLSSSVTYLF